MSTITARRQLRWIAWGTALGAGTFAVGYALPYSLGVEPSLPMELSAIPLSLIPLAFASAIVRYRLLDIEVIVKRALVYTAAFAAIVVIYAVLLEAVRTVFLKGNASDQWVLALLATLVAVLLTPPVKDFVQNVLDRAFYRDRYDYRRALVGFARDLNSDLDLNRLSERLVSRVVETLLVDRMALMLEDEVAPHFGSMRSSGFGDAHPPALRSDRRSGGVCQKVTSSRSTTLQPSVVSPSRRSSSGATQVCTTSYRVSRRKGPSPCSRSDERTPASRSAARIRRCSPQSRVRSRRRSRTRDSIVSCT